MLIYIFSIINLMRDTNNGCKVVAAVVGSGRGRSPQQSTDLCIQNSYVTQKFAPSLFEVHVNIQYYFLVLAISSKTCLT